MTSSSFSVAGGSDHDEQVRVVWYTVDCQFD
jgi:hypothetical protein